MKFIFERFMAWLIIIGSWLDNDKRERNVIITFLSLATLAVILIGHLYGPRYLCLSVLFILISLMIFYCTLTLLIVLTSIPGTYLYRLTEDLTLRYGYNEKE